MKIVKKFILDESKVQGWNRLSEKLLNNVNIGIFITASILFSLYEYIPQKYYFLPGISGILRLIIILILVLIYTPLHEIIHVLFNGKDAWKKSTIIIGFPAVSVFYNDYVNKKRTLICMIAPFTIFTLILIAVFFLVDKDFIKSFLTEIFLLNFILSSSDIFYFFYFLFKTKSNTIFYGSRWHTVNK